MIVLEARDVSKSFWIPDEHRDTIGSMSWRPSGSGRFASSASCSRCRSRCRRVSRSG